MHFLKVHLFDNLSHFADFTVYLWRSVQLKSLLNLPTLPSFGGQRSRGSQEARSIYLNWDRPSHATLSVYSSRLLVSL